MHSDISCVAPIRSRYLIVCRSIWQCPMHVPIDAFARITQQLQIFCYCAIKLFPLHCCVPSSPTFRPFARNYSSVESVKRYIVVKFSLKSISLLLPWCVANKQLYRSATTLHRLLRLSPIDFSLMKWQPMWPTTLDPSKSNFHWMQLGCSSMILQ